MSTLNHYDRIQKYLAKQLSPQQRQQFESDLGKDTDLKQEYAAVLATQKALETLGYQRVKRIAKKPLQVASRRYFIWAAAASILLLISALAAHWFAQPAPSVQALAQQYFENPISKTLKGEDNSSHLLKAATTAYEGKDYNTATNLLKQVRADDTYFSEAQFILGNAYFHTAQPEAAIKAYEQVLTTPNNSFSERAGWNLIMVHLYQGKVKQTRESLLELQQDTTLPVGRKRQIMELLESLPNQ